MRPSYSRPIVPGPARPFDAGIARAVEVSTMTVGRVRRRLAKEERTAALVPRPSTARRVTKLDGRGEALPSIEVCSAPPVRTTHWRSDVGLLTAWLADLQVMVSISYETVRQTLRKRADVVAGDALVPAAAGQRVGRLADGGRARRLPAPPTTRAFRRGVWTRPAGTSWVRSPRHCPSRQGSWHGRTMGRSATAASTGSW